MHKKILVCVGTRPNLIKITQLERCFRKYPQYDYILLHTGQHYDHNMNDIFFSELGIKNPDVFLDINKGTQIEIISAIMVAFERYIISNRPDLVVVPGDVNSSFACAFVAQRYGIPVAHIESGLRSGDMTMPEEANRILIDDLCDLFFVTEQSGYDNLIREGKEEHKIKFTGNTMIDSLIAFMPIIEKSTLRSRLTLDKYYLVTFHRPINVDNEKSLAILTELIAEISKRKQVVFPVHPRTRKRIEEFNLSSNINSPNILLTDPIGYIDFINLVKYSDAVITDSGGVQEETTYLGIPCLTIRPNTERPSTIKIGSNTLSPLDLSEINNHLLQIEDGKYKTSQIPKFWDGKSSERVVEEIHRYLSSNAIQN